MQRWCVMVGTTSILLSLLGCGDSGTNQPTTSIKSDVISDAYKLCSAMEATKLTTQCSVSGSNRTVDVTIDTNGSEARKICDGAAKLMAQHTTSFAGQWKLQIFSPYSGKRPIATCGLI